MKTSSTAPVREGSDENQGIRLLSLTAPGLHDSLLGLQAALRPLLKSTRSSVEDTGRVDGAELPACGGRAGIFSERARGTAFGSLSAAESLEGNWKELRCSV